MAKQGFGDKLTSFVLTESTRNELRTVKTAMQNRNGEITSYDDELLVLLRAWAAIGEEDRDALMAEVAAEFDGKKKPAEKEEVVT